ASKVHNIHVQRSIMQVKIHECLIFALFFDAIGQTDGRWYIDDADDFEAVIRAGVFFFFSSRRRHTRSKRDWSSDVCSSDLAGDGAARQQVAGREGRERPRSQLAGIVATPAVTRSAECDAAAEEPARADGRECQLGRDRRGNVHRPTGVCDPKLPDVVPAPTVWLTGTSGFFSCGIAFGGAGYCWGRNDSGELGTGSFSTFSTCNLLPGGTVPCETIPMAVAGGHTFAALDAHGVGDHACGLAVETSGLRAYCW